MMGKEWWRLESTSTATLQFPTRICAIPSALKGKEAITAEAVEALWTGRCKFRIIW